jgi:hypothetical protein
MRFTGRKARGAGQAAPRARLGVGIAIAVLVAALQLLYPVPGHGSGLLTPEGSVNGTYTFYTAAADRPTGIIDHMLQSKIFEMAHALWLSYQARITTFINQNGGQAAPGFAQSERHDWDQAKLIVGYNPTETWI